MNAEKFSESLNQIKDTYIDEAVTYQAPSAARKALPDSSKPFRTMKVWRGIAIAACALLAVGIIGITAIGLISSRSGSFPAGGAAAPDYSYNNNADSDNGGLYDTYEDGYKYEDGRSLGPQTEGEYTEEAEPAGDGSEDPGKAEADGGFASTMPSNENSKIIYTAYLNIDTTEFEEAQAQIEAATKAQGGYFENLDQGNYSSSYRSASYQIRIPAENFDAFLKETQGFGTVTSISQNASDVSDDYYDIESRLETEKAKLARLQELLSQAQNMSDIITIEGEIANVQWEIDNLSGSLKHYDSQVSYSTVTINLNEVYKVTKDDAPLTFGERISNAFKNGFRSFTGSMEDLLIWFAASWTWLLLIAIVIVAGIIILVKFTRKADKTDKK